MTLRIKSWHKVLIVKEEDLRGRNLRHGKVLKYIIMSFCNGFLYNAETYKYSHSDTASHQAEGRRHSYQIPSMYCLMTVHCKQIIKGSSSSSSSSTTSIDYQGVVQVNSYRELRCQMNIIIVNYILNNNDIPHTTGQATPTGWDGLDSSNFS